MVDAKRFVGIDGANAQLDVAIWPNGESLAVPTTRPESASWLGDFSPLTW
jgi:hypothetical protein